MTETKILDLEHLKNLLKEIGDVCCGHENGYLIAAFVIQMSRVLACAEPYGDIEVIAEDIKKEIIRNFNLLKTDTSKFN